MDKGKVHCHDANTPMQYLSRTLYECMSAGRTFADCATIRTRAVHNYLQYRLRDTYLYVRGVRGSGRLRRLSWPECHRGQGNKLLPWKRYAGSYSGRRAAG